MDKIEKIKEWVKKQKKEELARNSIGVITGKALFVDANELLSFLDTLSEEPDKSLEEEIDRFEDWMETYNQSDYPTSFTTRDIARHFAEWGAEHLRDSTKMIDKSLEEAAYKYSFDSRPSVYGQVDVIDAFEAGAEWQKEKMLKDAYVESQIVEDGRIELEGDPLPCLNPIILLPYPQFKPYGKVRIVVLKEEE